MFYACAERFDVIENFKKNLVFGWTKQTLGAGKLKQ